MGRCNQRHLCIIVDRATNKQLAEYEIIAEDWYFARRIAAQRFEEAKLVDTPTDWFVDSFALC